jgi:hypothetical protein
VTHERTGWALPAGLRVFHYFVNRRAVCRGRYSYWGPFLPVKPPDRCCTDCAVRTLKQILAMKERSTP